MIKLKTILGDVRRNALAVYLAIALGVGVLGIMAAQINAALRFAAE